MAKKKRSAKQKANDKRLGRMAKARGKRTKRSTRTIRVRTAKRKPNKARKRVRSVVKRRKSVSRKRSITSKIPFVNNPTIRKVATGIGLATIGTAVIGLVAPSIASNPIVKPALAFLGGGIPGVIGQVVVGGGIAGVSSIFSGGNSATVNNAGNSGFA